MIVILNKYYFLKFQIINEKSLLILFQYLNNSH